MNESDEKLVAEIAGKVWREKGWAGGSDASQEPSCAEGALLIAGVREALRGNREAMAMLGLGGIIVFMGITALSANVLLGRD